MISRAASKLLEGKSIVGLSLPVRVFHARSSVERICDIFTFAPHFLNQAAEVEGLERVKLIQGFLVSAMPLAICQWKPFNPLLGETYEGELTDGT